MKQLKAFLLLMILPLLGISQITLTANQARIANKAFVERDLFQQRTVELSGELDSCTLSCTDALTKKSIAMLRMGELLEIRGQIIKNDSAQFVNYEKEISRGNLHLNFVRTERTIFGVALIALAVKIFL